ncbi:DUF6916 family protein [Holophaga foetida]|uniref:DUF6916 family protein n=1 Tax=Holophaga foetida TaxID=35839 RepID=UPI0002474660|nr:hypothetical protein [Holophaga foetida]
MTPDQFRPWLGTGFEVQEGPCVLTLEAVEVFETSATEGFSLRFTGPRSPLLPQGTKRLTHAGLDPLDLFLVPVQDPRPEVYTYEAIFNRLRSAPQAPANGGA